jgi:peptidoglycan/LPS O-acetylase OafA/YrhL
MAARPSSHHFLPTLDGWRAIAISMVIVSHCLMTDSAGGGGVLGQLTFRLGTFGVMLFFAISGYLISTRLLIEEENTGRISLQSFYTRRIFRILPPAYIYLLVVGALAMAGIIVATPMDFAGAAFFFGNYVPSQAWSTGHFWSLSLEEHFYLLWPPVLYFCGRRRAIAAGALLIALTVFLRHRAVASLPAGIDLPGYTQFRLDAFMFPCILAILLRGKPFAAWFATTMKPIAWAVVILALGAGIFAGAKFQAWRDPQRLVQSALLPVIIVTTVLRPGDWFARLLQTRPLEWLGRISYSVYLWQQLVFGLAPRELSVRMMALPFLLAAILLLAAASYRWIELPMMAHGKRLSARWPPRANPSSPVEVQPLLPPRMSARPAADPPRPVSGR